MSRSVKVDGKNGGLRTAMRAGLTVVLCAAWISGARANAAEARDATKYVGVKTCAMCHKKEETGNQNQKWLDSKHAKAFESLASDKAKEVAKKLGIADPQQSGKCLMCHSTAYNWTEAVATDKIKPEDGVTCESCHGPGKDYKKKEIMENKDQAIAAGLVNPATKSCVLCHNDKNPTWNPEQYTTKDGKKVGFDEEQAFEKIKHPDPKLKK